nr:2-C-methyl-D-erythritol 2,4-cyclodiphosphate synthase [Dissulfurirhabdus thermomarina]
MVPGRPLVLGGVRIPHPTGLLGHSDADVLVHALADALLGAAGLGDIGRHFPDSDPRYKDMAGFDLLVQVVEMVNGRGWVLGNADLTLVAEAPKVAPFIGAMTEELAVACRSTPERINVKATTTEGLGPAGRGEGMAAYAVALIVPAG